MKTKFTRKEFKHVIWSNMDIDIKDWSDFLEEEYPEITDTNKQYELCCDLNNDYLDDERTNLNITLNNDIIVIADLGLWNGHHCGYKRITNNISDCLYDNDCAYAEWYVDRYNELRFTGYHHDGCNTYLYRVYKDNVTDDQKYLFEDKLYNGTATKNDMYRYTTSVGKYIADVYGWRYKK